MTTVLLNLHNAGLIPLSSKVLNESFGRTVLPIGPYVPPARA
jgi:succinate-acetate transporter protein